MVRFSTIIFSKKNAGKWVASKNGKVLATDVKLSKVLKKVEGGSTSDSPRIRASLLEFLAGFGAL